jgi:hypothetical protein
VNDTVTQLTLVVVILQAVTLLATIVTVVLFLLTLREAKATTKKARETVEEMGKTIDAISMLSESTQIGQLCGTLRRSIYHGYLDRLLKRFHRRITRRHYPDGNLAATK